MLHHRNISSKEFYHLFFLLPMMRAMIVLNFETFNKFLIFIKRKHTCLNEFRCVIKTLKICPIIDSERAAKRRFFNAPRAPKEHLLLIMRCQGKSSLERTRKIFLLLILLKKYTSHGEKEKNDVGLHAN